MAASNIALSESLSIGNIVKQVKYQRNFYRIHPGYFRPDGLVIFCGPQGSGKTLSAVNYVYKLMKLYTNCKLVTILELKDYPTVTFDEFSVAYRKDHHIDLEE